MLWSGMSFLHISLSMTQSILSWHLQSLVLSLQKCLLTSVVNSTIRILYFNLKVFIYSEWPFIRLWFSNIFYIIQLIFLNCVLETQKYVISKGPTSLLLLIFLAYRDQKDVLVGEVLTAQAWGLDSDPQSTHENLEGCGHLPVIPAQRRERQEPPQHIS